jgi:transcriptional regulator of NAD metabolism
MMNTETATLYGGDEIIYEIKPMETSSRLKEIVMKLVSVEGDLIRIRKNVTGQDDKFVEVREPESLLDSITVVECLSDHIHILSEELDEILR